MKGWLILISLFLYIFFCSENEYTKHFQPKKFRFQYNGLNKTTKAYLTVKKLTSHKILKNNVLSTRTGV